MAMVMDFTALNAEAQHLIDMALAADAADDAAAFAAKDAMIATLNAANAALQAQTAQLAADLAACLAQQPPPPPPPALPTFSVSDATTVSETAGPANFIVTMSSAQTSAVSVDYATVSGTATAGSDFTAKSGTLTFAPGTTIQTISVVVINDTAVEADETFSLKLSNARMGLSITDDTGAGTITSEDITPPPPPPPPPGAWPDATNTGVLPGIARTAYTGPMTITAAGTIIQNKNLASGLVIKAANCKVINCMITGAAFWGIDASDGGTNTTITDCTITGPGTAANMDSCITGTGTFLRNNCSQAENGIRIQPGSSTVRLNYVHDLNNSNGSNGHYDGICAQGGQNGVLIEDNSVASKDTSCIFLKNDFGAMSNVTVNHNKLTGNTAFPVYSVAGNGGGAPTGTKVTNNVIQKGVYNHYYTLEGDAVASGNTDFATGAPIVGY